MQGSPTPRYTSRSYEDDSNIAPDSTRPRHIYKLTPRATNDVLGRDRRQRGATQPPPGPYRPRSREQREREQHDYECQKLQDKIANDTRQAEVLAQFEAVRTADTADPHPTEMVSTRGEERRERTRQANEQERLGKLNGDLEVTGEEPQAPANNRNKEKKNGAKANPTGSRRNRRRRADSSHLSSINGLPTDAEDTRAVASHIQAGALSNVQIAYEDPLSLMESAREAIGRVCSDDSPFELLERKQSDNEYSDDTKRKRHRKREAKRELASVKKQKEKEDDTSNPFERELPIIELQRPANQGGGRRSLSSTPGFNNSRAFSSRRSARGNGRSARAGDVPPESLFANPQRRAGGNPESDDDYDEEDLRERLSRRGRSGLGGSAPQQVQEVEIPSPLAAAAQENPQSPLHATNTSRQGLISQQPVASGKNYTGIWARGFELDLNPPPKLITPNPVVDNPDAPVTTRSGRILGSNLASTLASTPTPVPSPVSTPVSQPPSVPTSKDTRIDKAKGKGATKWRCKRKKSKRKRTCKPVDKTEESDDGEICTVCQLPHSEAPNEILFCEKCDRGFHQECCDPKVFSMPQGDWLCKDCGPNRLAIMMKVKHVGSKLLEDDQDKNADQDESERKIRWKCKCKKGKAKCTCNSLGHIKKTEDEEVCAFCQFPDSESPNEILLCDSCDQGFHQECCEPKVFEISENDWLCEDCGPSRLPEDNLNEGTDQDEGRKRSIWKCKCKCKKGKLKCTCKSIMSPQKSEDHEDTDTDQDDGDVPNRPNVNKAPTTSSRTIKASESSTKNNKHTEKIGNHSGTTQKKSDASASEKQNKASYFPQLSDGQDVSTAETEVKNEAMSESKSNNKDKQTTTMDSTPNANTMFASSSKTKGKRTVKDVRPHSSTQASQANMTATIDATPSFTKMSESDSKDKHKISFLAYRAYASTQTFQSDDTEIMDPNANTGAMFEFSSATNNQSSASQNRDESPGNNDKNVAKADINSNERKFATINDEFRKTTTQFVSENINKRSIFQNKDGRSSHEAMSAANLRSMALEILQFASETLEARAILSGRDEDERTMRQSSLKSATGPIINFNPYDVTVENEAITTAPPSQSSPANPRTSYRLNGTLTHNEISSRPFNPPTQSTPPSSAKVFENFSIPASIFQPRPSSSSSQQPSRGVRGNKPPVINLEDRGYANPYGCGIEGCVCARKCTYAGDRATRCMVCKHVRDWERAVSRTAADFRLPRVLVLNFEQETVVQRVKENEDDVMTRVEDGDSDEDLESNLSRYYDISGEVTNLRAFGAINTLSLNVAPSVEMKDVEDDHFQNNQGKGLVMDNNIGGPITNLRGSTAVSFSSMTMVPNIGEQGAQDFVSNTAAGKPIA